MPEHILIRGAREHNLKNLSVSIPRNQLVVVTGVSGSGKSTLAFDMLHRESQRQIMECLGEVTFGISKAKADLIQGLPPSISVDQHLANRSPRSTVGTSTDVYTYLRVLFARLGRRCCPSCAASVPPSQAVASNDDEEDAPEETDPCPHCQAPLPRLGMAHFSFNKPSGACPACTGLGVVSQPVLERIIDGTRSIPDGGVLLWEKIQADHYLPTILRAAKHYGFSFDPDQPIGALGDVQRDLLLHGVESERFRRHVPGKSAPVHARDGRFEGVVTALMRRYQDTEGATSREHMERFLATQTCSECHGDRLRPESRAVRVADKSIVEIARASLVDVSAWVATLTDSLSEDERLVADTILADLTSRLQRLLDVGVGYLSMERRSPTLSAGEAERLRLASLLGSSLTGMLYVLDEPTTGLHPRDTRRLTDVLRRLRDLGNTVLVVEHDLDVIRAADHVIDIGPGAGHLGGTLIATGTPEQVSRVEESITGAFLAGQRTIPQRPDRRRGNGKTLVVRGARAHNLRNVTARLPLGMLVAVTGPTGSGKSSLILDVLGAAAAQRFDGAAEQPGDHDGIDGWECVDRVVMVDQLPLARSHRSNAATYTDAFTPLRELFAAQPEAKRAKISGRDFSFNVAGGRCERCEGAGVLSMEMHFMPEVTVRCPACRGKRFKPEVLAVQYRGWSISDVLERTVEEAYGVFGDVPKVGSRLKLLLDTGLGYLPLGQPATTLSGGEAQRVKLAKELGRREGGTTLYLLDEPTSGLHSADVIRLLEVLQRLVDAGNTVVVIEHNMDLVRAADWVLDLGPEGGAGGGRIMAEGTPEEVKRHPDSCTGRFL